MHRADLELVAVAKIDFQVPDLTSVDHRAIGAAQVAEVNPAVALLQRGVLLAHLSRAQPELAIAIASDQEPRSCDRDRAAAARTDLNAQTDPHASNQSRQDSRIVERLQVRLMPLGDLGLVAWGSAAERRNPSRRQ